MDKYNFTTVYGYSTNKWELTDFSNDISSYNFFIEYRNRNNAGINIFNKKIPLNFVSGSIIIDSKIEDQSVGVYDFILTMEKQNEKRIILTGVKNVTNDI